MKKLLSKKENRILLFQLADSALCAVLAWIIFLSKDALWDAFMQSGGAPKFIKGFIGGIYTFYLSLISWGTGVLAFLTIIFAAYSRLIFRPDGSMFSIYRKLVRLDMVLFIIVVFAAVFSPVLLMPSQLLYNIIGFLISAFLVYSQVLINKYIRMMKNDTENE